MISGLMSPFLRVLPDTVLFLFVPPVPAAHRPNLDTLTLVSSAGVHHSLGQES